MNRKNYQQFSNPLSGAIVNVINSVAGLTNLTSIAKLLTDSLTSITDAALLRQILTSTIGVDLLKSLSFPVLTAELMKLIGGMLGGLIDGRGLMNFVPRPSARDIFTCPENGSYSLNIFPFTGTTKIPVKYKKRLKRLQLTVAKA
jgi:hypothetical protein